MSRPADQLPEEAEPPRPGVRQWYGVWPGTIVNTDDPLQRGRVRIRVDQVYGFRDNEDDEKIPDDQLPWARPCFPVSGDGGDGVFHVPQTGAGVWVIFWKGDPEEPVWLGGFPGEMDVPDGFSGSYGPPGEGPQTRYIRTPGGQVMQMRWKQGEEEIQFEAPISPPTPANPQTIPGATVRIVHQEAQRFIELQTSTGQIVRVADLPVPTVDIISSSTVNVTGAGQVNLTGAGMNIQSTGPAPSVMSGGGGMTSNFLGAGAFQYLAYALTSLTTLALTTTGAMTLTAATLTLLTTGVLQLGVAGTYRRLIDERFATFYDSHTHFVAAAPGPSGPPQTLAVPQLANLATTNVLAN